jgi:hypothetical protein
MLPRRYRHRRDVTGLLRPANETRFAEAKKGAVQIPTMARPLPAVTGHDWPSPGRDPGLVGGKLILAGANHRIPLPVLSSPGHTRPAHATTLQLDGR